MRPATARDRLIVALDVPSVSRADQLIAELGEAASFYKIGYQLIYRPGGLDLAQRIVASGKKLFVDAKLLDIAETIENGVASIAALGAHFVTVHAQHRQTLAAAARAASGTQTRILGVTVLTSLDASDLAEFGWAGTAGELVRDRVKIAVACGIHGVVASGVEAPLIRAYAGTDLLIVTPGVRRATDAAGDQKRVVTPRDAVAGGADYIVVGRPIVASDNPRAAAEAIVAEMGCKTPCASPFLKGEAGLG